MADLFNQVYLSRASEDDKTLSCLALHPDGTVTTLSKALAFERHLHMTELDMAAIGTLNDYGYQLSVFFSCHTNSDPKNPFAWLFHRACTSIRGSLLTDDEYNNTMMRGPAYLVDDHKDLTMEDWNSIKYCWLSQDENVKRRWCAVSQSYEEAAFFVRTSSRPGATRRLSYNLAAVQSATTVAKSVIHSGG
jgi:hypothetical protein